MATLTTYATKAELKARLAIASADTVDDSILDATIASASRAIDHLCNRRFYTTPSNEARYFDAEFADLVLLAEDITSVSTLKTDEDGDRVYERTWAASDFELMPHNAALDGRPFNAIATTPRGTLRFPVGGRRSIEVTGRFGYTTAAGAIPSDINESTLLMAARLFRRKDTPFGIVPGEIGAALRIGRFDPQIRELLDPFRRMTIGVAGGATVPERTPRAF